MKAKLVVIILTLLISLSSQAPCTQSDYMQFFSECDSKGETRNVTIYLPSDCQNVIITDQSNPLSVYSTLPTITIPCSTTCEPGEYVTYDVMKKATVCSKCPQDTYSQGGDFKITTNWNAEIIKKNFMINCYAIDSTSYKKNEDCKTFNILNDKTMMTSGEITGNQIKYFFELIYFFKSKNNGRVLIKYKVDSIKEKEIINGQLRMFFDYEHVGTDNDSDLPIKTIYYDFGPGEHELVLFYNYYKMGERQMKLFIQSFEVIGIEDASYSCEKCIDGIALEGSDRCLNCKQNYYYDKATQECKECPKDQFSVLNSSIFNTCMKRQSCTDYDYHLIKATTCQNQKQTIEMSLIEPFYCLGSDANKVISKEVSCQLNNTNDQTNTQCPEGKGLISHHQYDFSQGAIEDYATLNNGWLSNGMTLFVGAYLNTIVDKTLIFDLQSLSPFASIKVSFKVNLGHNDFFNIKINNRVIHSYTNQMKTYTLNIPLGVEKSRLMFSYEKVIEGLLIDNPVEITSLEVIGTSNGKKQKCFQCPQDSISSQKDNLCQQCSETEIPNEDQSQCITCTNGIHDIINGKLQCIDCPSYTYFNGKKCLLNEVLHQKNKLLKYNLSPMKDWLNKLCNDQSGILCYENAFIGPINNKVTNTTSHDIFFISLFEPKKIDITDFAYDDNANMIKQGHIFGLFSVNKPVINNSTQNNEGFIDHNVTYQNTKIKKNIAQQINHIHLLGKSINASKRIGIIIDFKEGDVCINNPEKRYKAYVYLKCEKYEISAPKIINVIDDGCTFIFEWSSPYICKNCVTKEISHFERGTCKNNQRQIIFSPNEECLIFNATNPVLKGYDRDYDEALLTQDSPIYKMFFGNKGGNRDLNVVIVEKNQEVEFMFDYIENKTYYEECSFIDNIDNTWKKYLLIIPILYLITCFLVICYCCKYRKIKNQYEKLRGNDVTRQDIGKDKEDDSKKKENNIEIV